LAMDRHAARHAAQELVGDRMIHGHQVLLLQLVFRAQDRVDDVAVAGQQDQAFRILVQAADREDPPFVAHQVDDVALHRRLGGAGDADRLVQRDIDVFALAPGGAAGTQGLAVDLDLVALADLGPDARPLAVHRDAALADQTVGLAPRAEAGVADVLVESHPDRGVAGGAQSGRSAPARHAMSRAAPFPPLPRKNLTYLVCNANLFANNVEQPKCRPKPPTCPAWPRTPAATPAIPAAPAA